ncbi:MAG: hypothetical protein FIA92_00950 [Chloroflexi bacterium]|nr:hypothetical protein [Chloroflexota bacterium]
MPGRARCGQLDATLWQTTGELDYRTTVDGRCRRELGEQLLRDRAERSDRRVAWQGGQMERDDPPPGGYQRLEDVEQPVLTHACLARCRVEDGDECLDMDHAVWESRSPIHAATAVLRLVFEACGAAQLEEPTHDEFKQRRFRAPASQGVEDRTMAFGR